MPSGSHTGQILYVLSCNDVTTCFKFSNVFVYVDNLKFYNVVSTDHLQNDLDNFSSWYSLNHLNINICKCKSSFYNCQNPIISSNSINSEPIGNRESVNDLGDIFQSDFALNHHIDNTIAKCLRMLVIIKRNTKHSI